MIEEETWKKNSEERVFKSEIKMMRNLQLSGEQVE